MARRAAAGESRGGGVAEAGRVRDGLLRRLAKLQDEHDQAGAVVDELRGESRDEPVGDDADLVGKASDLDWGRTIVTGLRERIGQARQALRRLDEGRYGWCEQCEGSIPAERLVAFPDATLCVACKSQHERR